MERARWTDERLDERMTAIDNRFDHLTFMVALLGLVGAEVFGL